MAEISLFEEELEALQAIYMDDLIVSNSDSCETVLQITLHPSTADDFDKKFVCLTLICHIQSEYPDKAPKLFVKNPRGISDAHLTSIEENLAALSNQKIGEAMLFDLLQYAQDSLTDNNHPSCVCPICLEYFKEYDEFFRTECYHYFHYPCMKGYMSSNQEPYVCPVCRYEIKEDDVVTIKNHFIDGQTNNNQETQSINAYISTKQYKDWLKNCKVMFEKQKNNGGIIDLEYEKNKYLVSAETNFTLPAITPEPSESNDDSGRISESTVKKKPYIDKHNSKKDGKSPGESSVSQNGKCECPKSSKGKSRPQHRKPPRKPDDKSRNPDSKNRVSETGDSSRSKPHRKKTDRPYKENRDNAVAKTRQENGKRDRSSKENKNHETTGEKMNKTSRKSHEILDTKENKQQSADHKVDTTKRFSEKPDERPLKVDIASSKQCSNETANTKKIVRPPPGFKPLT